MGWFVKVKEIDCFRFSGLDDCIQFGKLRNSADGLCWIFLLDNGEGWNNLTEQIERNREKNEIYYWVKSIQLKNKTAVWSYDTI